MVTKRRTVTRKKSMAAARKGKKNASFINVRSENDIKPALDILKKSPIVLVLVYANWCPHCHSYMPFWDKLSKTSGRNVPMIAAEQAFSEPIMSNIMQNGKPMTVEGYPTVIAVGKEPMTGMNVGAEIPNSRDETVMTNMVRNGATIIAPSSMNTVKNANAIANASGSANTNTNFRANVNTNVNARANTNAVNVDNRMPTSPVRVSNIVGQANTYVAREESPMNAAIAMEEPPSMEEPVMNLEREQQQGGSLYESLMALSTASAPAALLLGAAAAAASANRRQAKRTKRTRRTRRVQRRSPAKI